MGLGLLAPTRYEIDLSNEVLNIHFVRLLGNAKISEVKVGGQKNLPDQPGPGRIGLESGRVGNSLSTSNFDL